MQELKNIYHTINPNLEELSEQISVVEYERLQSTVRKLMNNGINTQMNEEEITTMVLDFLSQYYKQVQARKQ